MGPPLLLEIQIVCALYDYKPDADGRVAFTAGDEIQLLHQHPNGWSDGICNRRRGWFPTNYASPPEQRYVEPLEKFGWTCVPCEDLRLERYFNPLTGESRAVEMPPNSFSGMSRATSSSINSIDSLLLSERRKDLADEVEMQTIGFPEEEDGFSQRYGSFSSSSTLTDISQNKERNSVGYNQEEGLHSFWGVKSAPDGRKYYYNMLTNETTWNKDLIDSHTGKLKKSDEDASNGRAEDVPGVHFSRSPSSPWESFSLYISSAVNAINDAAKDEDKPRLAAETSALVHSVQSMLNTADESLKGPQILKKHKMLRIYRKNIQKTVSQLILTVKEATGMWPPPDTFERVISNAKDTFLAIRHFTIAAQEANIDFIWKENNVSKSSLGSNSNFPPIKSPLAFSGDETESVHQPQVSLKDLFQQIDASLAETTAAIEKFKAELGAKEVKMPSLILTAQATVTEVGQLLSLMEDVQSFDSSTDESVSDFEKKRQKLHENVSSLVSATLSMTDTLAPADALSTVAKCLIAVEEAVLGLVLSSKHVIEALDVDEYKSLTAMLDDLCVDRRGSQLSVRLRRAISFTASQKPPVHRSSTTASHYRSSRNSAGPSKTMHRLSSTPADAPPRSSAPSSPSSYKNLIPYPSTLKNDHQVSASAPSRRLTALDSRISRFFGETPTLEDDDKSFLNEPDTDPKDLVLSMEGAVKGGTVPALIERLTSHNAFDAHFMHAFLMTFRSFAGPLEVLKLLVNRFLLEPPIHLNDEQLYHWGEKKLKPIRLRVFNVMKTWLDSFFYPGDEVCLPPMASFALGPLGEAMPSTAEVLLRFIEKRKHSNSETCRRKIPTTTQEAPPPILPRNLRRIRLLEIDPTEWARQLTILESELYNNIQPLDCLNKAWSDKSSHTASNIRTMIHASNKITSWVAESILSETDIKRRSSIMKHFILIADRCRSLQNFNSVMAILAGLNSSPVHRLKRTKDLLSARVQLILDKLKKLMSPLHNFAVYRRQLRSIHGPCVPFLGMYLTDLTFIEDGNPNMLKSHPHLINLDKRLKAAQKIQEIQSYQQSPYTLTPVTELQDFLHYHLSGTEETDSEVLYQASLQLEPREREDEKIARLLQESGFL